ncbi:MAG: TetR family transcriptional regulator [Mesorhizobium sp.]|nr:TetR family transcriptional regulator [Mesorhizobium sp.]
MRSAAETRRLPSQQRSRERVERMLAAASELIAEQGTDALKMRDVAERASVPIGSLYQFFPDKGAVIRALAERITAEGRACIAEALTPVRDTEDFRSAFNGLVDTYYALFLAEPVMRDIWSGTQADRTLRALELADSRASAALLAKALLAAQPGREREAAERTAFFVWQLGEAAVRLAVSVGRQEGDAMVETYKRMALRELLGD